MLENRTFHKLIYVPKTLFSKKNYKTRYFVTVLKWFINLDINNGKKIFDFYFVSRIQYDVKSEINP